MSPSRAHLQPERGWHHWPLDPVTRCHLSLLQRERFKSKCTELQWGAQFLWLLPTWWWMWRRETWRASLAPTRLEALCWWHLHSPSQEVYHHTPGPPQWQTIHQVHGRRGGLTAGVPGCDTNCTGKMAVQSTFLLTTSSSTPTSTCPSGYTIYWHTWRRLLELWWSEQTTCLSQVWSERRKRSMSRMHWEAMTPHLASSKSTLLPAKGERKKRSRDRR